MVAMEYVANDRALRRAHKGRIISNHADKMAAMIKKHDAALQQKREEANKRKGEEEEVGNKRKRDEEGFGATSKSEHKALAHLQRATELLALSKI